MALAYVSRAGVREEKGDIDGTLSDLNQAIRIQPTLKAAIEYREFVLKKLNNQTQTEFVENQAVLSQQEKAKHYNKKGLKYGNNGDYEKAIDSFSQALVAQPNYLFAYFNRAKMWEKEKRYSLAVADYQSFLALGGGKKHKNQEKIENSIKKLKSKLK